MNRVVESAHISQPGIYSMPAEVYHADPVKPAPSLSASIAKILCQESPLHAWASHPRLNPDYSEEEKDIFDLGKICHSLMLEGIDIADVLDFKDYKTNAAKEAKAASRAAGRIPVLENNWPRVLEMIDRGKKQIEAHRDASDAFTNGKPEQTLIWFDEEFGVWCRARLDWLHDSYRIIDDYKSTGMNANPETIGRMMFGSLWEVQAAFYQRGLKILTGVEAQFRFVVQETQSPFALSVIGLSPMIEIEGQKKIFHAMEIFKRCLDSGSWPGYPNRICYPEMPIYLQAAWESKETNDLSNTASATK